MQERRESLHAGDGTTDIGISLGTPDQIFTPFTPVPSLARELTPATEEYLVDMFRDMTGRTPIRISLRMPAAVAALPESLAVPEAIRNHFRYRMTVADRQYRQMLRFGKRSFVIALMVLAVAMFVSRAIFMYFDELLYVVMIAEGATVVGWVALWAPASILVLELWPNRETRRIFEKIADAEIIIVPEP